MLIKNSIMATILIFSYGIAQQQKVDPSFTQSDNQLSVKKMTMMAAGGLAGSLVGIVTIGLPVVNYYANNVGSYEDPLPTIAFLSSYIIGNAIGVYLTGNYKAKTKGRFIPTLIGSTVGIIISIPGPPIGGVIGYKKSLKQSDQLMKLENDFTQ